MPTHVFNASPGRTLGVEWELGLLDAQTLELVPRAHDLLTAVQNHPEPLRGAEVTKELLTNTVEIVTGICENATQAQAELGEALTRVHDVAGDLGFALYGGGSHPLARWEDQEVSDGPRYETLIDRTQWWGRQMVIFGVHVHVGVRSAAKVWPLVNALLTYHPHLTALSASSPYWAGEDTGYASNRTMLFQQLPTAGLPFQFETWSAYRSYLHDVFATGVVSDPSELRWDIRPSLNLGTIEVRTCDGLSDVTEVAAVAALVHCLTLHLEELLDAGQLPAPLPPWHVQENKWRAARYGLDAIVITDAASREQLVTDHLRELLNRLEPVAQRLGCENELAGVEQMLQRGAGYQRMRAAAAAGDLRDAVQAMLIPRPG